MGGLVAGERKVYSEFFTNLAVAWFTGGVISPFFTTSRNIFQLVVLVTWGILGAWAFLKFAVFSARGGK
jgi:hypothetical protein